MRPLADKALAAWRAGEVVFYPKKWENTYSHWLENIRDWCISRQLWWGHRIPVWYCEKCGETIVSRDDPQKCPKCGAPGDTLRQDPDVLDTWFSSWLWPFSTLGWPEKTADLATFYPTTALVTAYDIIFFWVSRMIMAGLEFTGQVPFRDVYIHGLVRDKQGRKMSKSLGNGLDPLVLVDEYGSDALKFTLGFLAAQGQDILVDGESFKLGSRFANKIWNASRYILGNLEGRAIVAKIVGAHVGAVGAQHAAPVPDASEASGVSDGLSDVDKWIYSRLNAAAAIVRDAIDGYRYNEAAQALYDYFWNDFCDWYVEATKLLFRGEDDGEKDRAATVLLLVLEESLRLLHPYLPFVTEEIYSKLPPEVKTGELLISAPYPVPDKTREYAAEAADFAQLQELVRGVRALRSDCGIDPAAKVVVTVVTNKNGASATGAKQATGAVAPTVFCLLANAGSVDFADTKPTNAIGAPCGEYEVFIHTGVGVDLRALVARFEKERAAEAAFADKLEAKLAGSFAQKAPPEVVAQERDKLAKARSHAAKLAAYSSSLQGGT
jgi:valyl-tRNA synthetase